MQAPRLCIACRSRRPVGGCEVSLFAAAGPRGRRAAARRSASKRSPSRPARAHPVPRARPVRPPTSCGTHPICNLATWKRSRHRRYCVIAFLLLPPTNPCPTRAQKASQAGRRRFDPGRPALMSSRSWPPTRVTPPPAGGNLAVRLPGWCSLRTTARLAGYEVDAVDLPPENSAT